MQKKVTKKPSKKATAPKKVVKKPAAAKKVSKKEIIKEKVKEIIKPEEMSNPIDFYFYNLETLEKMENNLKNILFVIKNKSKEIALTVNKEKKAIEFFSIETKSKIHNSEFKGSVTIEQLDTIIQSIQ